MQVLQSSQPLKKEKLSYYSAQFVRSGAAGKKLTGSILDRLCGDLKLRWRYLYTLSKQEHVCAPANDVAY